MPDENRVGPWWCGCCGGVERKYALIPVVRRIKDACDMRYDISSISISCDVFPRLRGDPGFATIRLS